MARRHVLASLLAIALLLAATSCSPRPVAKSPRPSGLGPFPLDVTIEQGSYILRLSAVSVPRQDAIPLAARSVPNMFVGPKKRARPGHRYVDATLSVAAPGYDEPGVPPSVITTASVTASGRHIAASSNFRSRQEGTPFVQEAFEFEVPASASSVVMQVILRGSSEPIAFRLW